MWIKTVEDTNLIPFKLFDTPAKQDFKCRIFSKIISSLAQLQMGNLEMEEEDDDAVKANRFINNFE